MPTLDQGLRKKLENAVKDARDVAELGARAALEQLAVHAPEPFEYLSPEDRDLRNRLRARARQLGDVRDARTGVHQIDHLVVECAYEHWHRMLFARFLAESGVLMANSEALGIENTPVTLEECEELAADEGAANGWELAGRYASRMLPQIFRPDAPVLAVHLPPERQRRLEQLLADLAPETFKASDALGWVYQFWQAKKKQEVNDSGAKIGADELPAVTQLFTEPYMVDFLLHNTLGAWWAGKVLADQSELARTARSEDELRQACALPGYVWTHLRFICENGRWYPAAGTFDGWPRKASELKLLDPCCGSGHFLVAAFEVLVCLRIQEERLEAASAVDAVLRDNLHGLELDERCTQIAAFALALAAWTHSSTGGYRALPQMKVACSGSAPVARREEWLALAGDDERLRSGMERLHEVFQDAPTLGSLLNPNDVGYAGAQRELGIARFEELRPLLDAELVSTGATISADRRELAVAAKGIIEAAGLLGGVYTLILTNVPYLSGRKQSATLFDFISRRYPRSTSDLSAALIERCWEMLVDGGTTAVVSPQLWLFTSSYQSLRESSLTGKRWNLLCRLGPGAFETISGQVVNVALVVTTHAKPRETSRFAFIDVTSEKTAADKSRALSSTDARLVEQQSQVDNPGSRITGDAHAGESHLSTFVDAPQGIKTGDDFRWRRYHWEIPRLSNGWQRLQSTVSHTQPYGGRSLVIDWSTGGRGMIRPRLDSVAVGRMGVAVSQTGDLPCTLYGGDRFDSNVAPLVPVDPDDVPAIWAFCSSPEYRAAVREIDQSLKVSNVPLTQVRFDADRWRTVAADVYPNGLPDQKSSDPTQWFFDGMVAGSEQPAQVAVSRLLGYRWPDQPIDGIDERADDDGVVCLPSVRGEEPGAERLLALLRDAYVGNWTTSKRDTLLSAVGAKGKGVDWWLRNRFFEQHCQLFQHRPFIWHIWDGVKQDGFGALVNYHKLDRKLLETLTYTYLGDWIRRQQDDAARNVDRATERHIAAVGLQKRLEMILEGEKPYDIFVRWKPLHRQPIGWEPDINDGVRMNIRPFMSVPDVDRKGAGILRYKPNINWGKDRGIDPDDAPWFDLGPSYGESKGSRINDHHLSLAEKRAAWEARGGRS